VPLFKGLNQALGRIEQRAETLDEVSERLKRIVYANREGLTITRIVQAFWQDAGGLLASYPDLNNRELFYRLFFLQYRRVVEFDATYETFRPLSPLPQGRS